MECVPEKTNGFFDSSDPLELGTLQKEIEAEILSIEVAEPKKILETAVSRDSALDICDKREQPKSKVGLP